MEIISIVAYWSKWIFNEHKQNSDKVFKIYLNLYLLFFGNYIFIMYIFEIYSNSHLRIVGLAVLVLSSLSYASLQPRLDTVKNKCLFNNIFKKYLWFSCLKKCYIWLRYAYNLKINISIECSCIIILIYCIEFVIQRHSKNIGVKK